MPNCTALELDSYVLAIHARSINTLAIPNRLPEMITSAKPNTSNAPLQLLSNILSQLQAVIASHSCQRCIRGDIALITSAVPHRPTSHLVLLHFHGLGGLHVIDVQQHVIAKAGNRIAAPQIADPVQHELDAVRGVGLEVVPEHLPHFAEGRHVLAQVEDEEDAEEGLRPAEEVWHEALLP
jgi:hypothetical protein